MASRSQRRQASILTMSAGLHVAGLASPSGFESSPSARGAQREEFEEAVAIPSVSGRTHALGTRLK